MLPEYVCTGLYRSGRKENLLGQESLNLDISEILGRIGQYLSMLLPLVIVFGVWGLIFWRKVQRRRSEVKRHKDAGTIGPAAVFQGGPLPTHYNLLASVGTGGPAATTLNVQIMKPAIGVRLFVLGLLGAVIYFVTQPSQMSTGFDTLDPGGFGMVMSGLLLIAAVNGVFYIFTFETRYDRDVLIVTRMMFFRREYRWKNLWRIGDDEAYELHLFFEPGGKAKVLKHSTGIADFKTFALAQIQKNRASHA